jgi:hypothetical protein
MRLLTVFAALAAALVAMGTAAQSNPAQSNPAQSNPAQSDPAQRLLAERITEAAAANRQRLEFDGKKFSGPAWESLIAEGKRAQFFLLGEEHGIAENPKLTAALFTALTPDSYARFMIEVSPPMATALDEAARDGVEGLQKMFATPGSEPAFYGMAEEAAMLAQVRAAVQGEAPVFWGADYEVGGDRLLIATLENKSRPTAADAALAALRAASDAAWAQYQDTRNPQFIFSFAGDPALARSLRDAWPGRDAETSAILDTLEETLAINRLWVDGQGFASNERRSAFMRRNFIAGWQAEKAAGRRPKVFAKFGASHLVRGRNNSEVYDLGTLLPEAAALEGGHAFHLLLLPGVGASTAVFNPSTWSYDPAPPKDDYMQGLEPILGAAHPDAFTLIDLRPLRPLLGRWREDTHPELMRVVHGFDALLVMSGSTPSSNLPEAPQ